MYVHIQANVKSKFNHKIDLIFLKICERSKLTFTQEVLFSVFSEG